MYEYPLDGDHVGTMLDHQRRHRTIDALQSHSLALPGDGDATAGDMSLTAAQAINHAVARALRARVEPQHTAIAYRQPNRRVLGAHASDRGAATAPGSARVA